MGLFRRDRVEQGIGSFKLRGAANAMLLASPEELRNGAYTCSAGNMASGGNLDTAKLCAILEGRVP